MKIFYKKDYFEALKQLRQEKLRYETDLEDYNEVKYQKMAVEEKLSKLEQKLKIKKKDYEEVLKKFNEKIENHKKTSTKLASATKKIRRYERRIDCLETSLKNANEKIKHLEEINKDLKSDKYKIKKVRPAIPRKSTLEMSSKKTRAGVMAQNELKKINKLREKEKNE